MSLGWEIIGVDCNGEPTEIRARVHGGWVLVLKCEMNTDKFEYLTDDGVFIPDPDHEWPNPLTDDDRLFIRCRELNDHLAQLEDELDMAEKNPVDWASEANEEEKDPAKVIASKIEGVRSTLKGLRKQLMEAKERYHAKYNRTTVEFESMEEEEENR